MPSRPKFAKPILVLGALMVLMWGLWSFWVLIDNDRRGLFAPMVLDGSELSWRLINGTGQDTEAGLEIQRPGSRGETAVLLDLPSDLAASQFDRAVVTLQGGSSPNLTLEWSEGEQFSMMGLAPVVWTGAGYGEVFLDESIGWRGEPRQLMLRSFGFNGSWVLASVELYPAKPDFWGLQHWLWKRLYVSDPWHVRNINWQYPQGYFFEVSVTFFFATWGLLGLLVLVVVRRMGGRWSHGLSIGWLLVPIVVAWLLLDLRWQVELVHKARQTITAFAGMDVEARGQAELDSTLFEFSETLKQSVDRSQFNRVFAVGDPYMATRLRYRLAGWRTRFVPVQLFARELVPNLAEADLVLLDDRYDFEVSPMSRNPSSGNGQQVMVQSSEGKFLMQGEVVLNVGQYWALKVP